jgi:hypothetical protein
VLAVLTVLTVLECPPMADRRRLPVVQDPPRKEGAGAPAGQDGQDADDEARPPWHWIGFGVVAIFAAWLPLAAGATALARRAFDATFGAGASEVDVTHALAAMTSGERVRFTLTQALPQAAALGLAAFAGGFLVGRFGNGTGPREAALSGFATALMAAALTVKALELGWVAVVTLLVTALLATGFSTLGGRAGAKRRAAA